MSTEIKSTSTIKGGEWLVKESSPFETFTPENFTEEQLMIRDMCDQFLDIEIYPNLDRIDNLEPGLMKSLLTKAGEQGLLSTSFPEEYGGLGKDFVTSTIINEYLGAGHSFSVAKHPSYLPRVLGRQGSPICVLSLQCKAIVHERRI